MNINKYVNCHHLGFISLDSLLTVLCGGEKSPVPGQQSAGVARLAWGSGGMSWYYPLPETKIDPETQWLEDGFPFGMFFLFQGGGGVIFR